MDSAYLQTLGTIVATDQKADTQIRETSSNLCKLIIPIAIRTSLAVAGIFFVLAAAQVLPHGANIISSWGTWEYVAGAIVIGGGIIAFVVSLALYFRHKPKAGVSQDIADRISQTNNNIYPILPAAEKTIGDQEFKEFCAYKKGEDKICAHALGASFFYFDCDEVKDYGWGCAWRCIQICASAVHLFPKFKEIYDKYRLDTKSQKEWAEPGYGKRYLDDEEIPNQLILYNKESGTSKTPTEWCGKIRGFPALRDRLIMHFNQYATPVMADE